MHMAMYGSDVHLERGQLSGQYHRSPRQDEDGRAIREKPEDCRPASRDDGFRRLGRNARSADDGAKGVYGAAAGNRDPPADTAGSTASRSHGHADPERAGHPARHGRGHAAGPCGAGRLPAKTLEILFAQALREQKPVDFKTGEAACPPRHRRPASAMPSSGSSANTARAPP
jgi:hypothetical protein